MREAIELQRQFSHAVREATELQCQFSHAVRAKPDELLCTGGKIALPVPHTDTF